MSNENRCWGFLVHLRTAEISFLQEGPADISVFSDRFISGNSSLMQKVWTELRTDWTNYPGTDYVSKTIIQTKNSSPQGKPQSLLVVNTIFFTFSSTDGSKFRKSYCFGFVILSLCSKTCHEKERLKVSLEVSPFSAQWMNQSQVQWCSKKALRAL